jgi:hypothetical protein
MNLTIPRKEIPKLHHYNFTIIHSHYSPEIPHISSFERKNNEVVKEPRKSTETLNFYHQKSQKILNMIKHHNLKIKHQICKYSSEATNSFENIKKELSQIRSLLNSNLKKKLTKTDLYLKLTESINNVNLIKALLIKLTNLTETLKASKCTNNEDFSKQKLLMDNEVNSLVETFQNFIRKNDLHINLVILT